MKKISSPNHFPTLSLMASFSGKDHADALQKATVWEGQVGVTITHYFEQEAFGNSIWVSYEKENKDGQS